MSTASVPPSRWLRVPRPVPGATSRLICIPYAGGGSSVYRAWPEIFSRLLPQLEVVLVNLPGREMAMNEPLIKQLGELTPKLAKALAPKLDLPFAIYGHSIGALIAFELAHWLRANGNDRLTHLFAAAKAAPQLPLTRQHLHNMPTPQLIDELRRLEGTPEEILQNQELMALVLPILRADFSLNETYTYTTRPRLSIPLTVFGSPTDADASESELNAWREQAGGAFRLQMFPGGHFFLHPQAESLLREIARELQVARVTA